MKYTIPLTKDNVDVLVRARDRAYDQREALLKKIDDVAEPMWYERKRHWRCLLGFKPPEYTSRWEAIRFLKLGAEFDGYLEQANTAASAEVYIDNALRAAHYKGATTQIHDFQLSYINAFLYENDRLSGIDDPEDN